MPFYALDSEAEPEIVVEQVAPHSFILTKGFRYRAPFRDAPFIVPVGETTDLASVPWPLWWLIASYGRHTKAALVHDALIDPSDRIREQDRIPRRDADTLFFHALKESGFGEPRERRRTSWTRRWIMYAAVAVLGTLREQACLRFVLFLAHLSLALAMSTCLVLSRWVEGAWPLSFLDFAIPVLDARPLEGGRGMVIVALSGFLWAFDRRFDTKLGFGLWPAAIFAVAVALPFTLVLAVPWLIFAIADFLYNVAVSIKRRQWQGLPVVTPTRTPGEL